MRWDPVQRLFLVYRGGGDPAPQQTTTTNQMFSPEEAARRAKLMAQAEQLYSGAAAATAANPPGAPSADTIAAQNMMRTMAANNPTADMSQQLQAAQTFGFDAAMNPTATPGYQSTLDTATRKVTEGYTGPSGPFAQIRQGYTAGNSGGTGTREGIAMGMAGRDYLNTIGDVSGKFAADAYRSGLDLYGRTMAMAPASMAAVQGSAAMPANVSAALGADTEARAEAQRQWEMNSQWDAFAPYARAVMGAGPTQSSSTQTQATGESGGWTQHAGAAMTGAAMFPGHPGTGAVAGLMLSLFS